MKPTITVNQYPIGWEWLDRVPLEDFTWLIEIFSTMTDNIDYYIDLLEEPETLYENAEQTINLFKSFIK